MPLFLFIFCIYNIQYRHSFNPLIRRHSPGPFSISSSLCKLSGKNPPCGAEPRIELGPALQQADALATEPRRTIATPHHLHIYTHFLTELGAKPQKFPFGKCFQVCQQLLQN
jgi:hypothetical protein